MIQISRYCIFILLLLLTATQLFAQGQASVTIKPADAPASDVLLIVNGKLVEAEQIEMQRGTQVMVWVREIERLGWAKIEPGRPDQVSLKNNNVSLTFTKGQGIALVNSLAVKLPIDIYMKDNRMMVPLSFVAKAFGYDTDISNKTVVNITTTIIEEITTNRISGKVLYNGKGVKGVTIRAVDTSFTVINDASAITDANGYYQIKNLPDGKFMAYAYTGDNPQYFNRASNIVALNNGQSVEVEALPLGRILTPKSPASGSKNISLSKKHVDFSWSPCEGAASYELVLKVAGAKNAVTTLKTAKAEAKLSSSALKSGIKYEIQVSALNAGGEYLGGTAGAGGTPWTFTTVK